MPPSPPEPNSPAPAGRGRRSILIGLAAIPLVLLVAAFLLVPPIAKSQLVQFLESRTGGQAQVGKIRFNPITLRAEIEAFGLTEAGATEPVIAFESLVVDARWFGFLSSDAELDAIVLSGPEIRVELDEQGNLNLAQLFASEDVEETPAEGEGDEVPLVLELDALKIEGGRVLFRDRQRNPVFDLSIEPLDLIATDLSTSAGRQGTYDLQLSIGEATELSWTGSIGTEPLASSGELSIQNFDLRWVAAYLAEQLQFDLASGGLDIRAGYVLKMDEGLSLSVEGADMVLRSVSMLDPKQGEEFFGVKNISVGPIEARVGELGLESLSIGNVRGSGGRIATAREKDETIRLVEFLTPAEPAKSEKAVAADSVVVAEAAEVAEAVGEVIAGGEDATKAPETEITVAAIRFEDFEILIEDRVPNTPATIALTELLVEITGYSNTSKEPLAVRIESRLGKQGQFKIAGPLQLAPLSGQLKVDLEKLALNEWTAYLDGVAQLEIPEGVLGASLELSLKDQDGAVSVSVKGRAQVDDLKTLDCGNARKFIEWGSLRLEGLDYSPEQLVLSEVVLSKAMARIVRDARGKTNLDSIFASPAGEPGAAAGSAKLKSNEGAAADPLKIRIDRITLKGVGFAFSDLAPDPHFTIDLAGLTGTVEGLSSEAGSRAKVNLEGRIDDTAPIRVSGQINPLAGDAYTDIQVRVSGISMPTFSPYSGRFAGFAIERGKLDLDLAYKLNAKNLRAENRIELHEFNFGKAVKSDDATTLPLRLATEVLRNSNGDIHLDIPLRGNLADPSFSILQLASKTFVNIITRIATSPFSIVGGLLPGQGEKISQVQFEAGSSKLSAAELEDLQILAGILIEKPALRVEIRGRADPAVDEPGVREALGGRDEIVDADWRTLARARAKAAREALLARPEIDPERLFMVDVEVGQFVGEDGRVATQLGLQVR